MLGDWAVTHSLKDGCLQAYLFAVIAQISPLALKIVLRTLANDLGCFPLDPGPSRPGSVSFISFFCIRSFLEVGRAVGPPHPLSALPQQKTTKGSTSIDFVENQLLPSLISLSPLLTSHHRILPHTCVRSSTACYSKLQPAHE